MKPVKTLGVSALALAAALSLTAPTYAGGNDIAAPTGAPAGSVATTQTGAAPAGKDMAPAAVVPSTQTYAAPAAVQTGKDGVPTTAQVVPGAGKDGVPYTEGKDGAPYTTTTASAPSGVAPASVAAAPARAGGIVPGVAAVALGTLGLLALGGGVALRRRGV